MLHRSLYIASSLILGSLCLFMAQPGQTQTYYEADVFGSLTIITPQSSTFKYTLYPGGILLSTSASGTGFAFADGSTNTSTSTYSSGTPDTVQTDGSAIGSTSVHLDKASSSSGTPTNNVTGIALTNTGKSKLTFQFVWQFDLYATATGTTYHDTAIASAQEDLFYGNTTLIADPAVSASWANHTTGPYENSLTETFNATLPAKSTEVLAIAVLASGAAQTTPEPGVSATVIGLGCGIAGLLLRRRRR
jgi:hypothetical protein